MHGIKSPARERSPQIKRPAMLVLFAVGILLSFAAQGLSSSNWAHLMLTAVFIVFIAAGFDKSRLREAWAKVAFAMVGGFGIAYSMMRFLLNLNIGPVFVGEDAGVLLATARGLTLGLMLGLILALAISGQLLGEHRPSE